MKILDFIVINNLTIGVTTVSFSKDPLLLDHLQGCGFTTILTNTRGVRFTKEELIDFLSQCDVAIVGLDLITEEVLSQTPRLKAISKYGVGLDNIDFEACKTHGVSILHTQGVNKRSVSEMTLGFMLALTRNLYVTANLLKQGIWHKSGGTQLSHKVVGIIGVGHIGKDLISLLKPFGCTILVNDVIDQHKFYLEQEVIEVSKEEIYQKSDIITIHTPLTPETYHLINKQSLSLMKPTAIVINTARGGIVDQEALKEALQKGTIGAAAIDAYESEPPEDNDFVSIPHLMATPHIGGNAQEAVHAMGIAAIENITSWIKGQ